MLEIKNLTIKFGDEAVLCGRSFTFPAGMTKVEGPSGCGKSSFFRSLMGRLPPDSGSLFFDGIDIYSLNENERSFFLMSRLSILPHEGLLLPSLSLDQNIALYRKTSSFHPFNEEMYKKILSRLSFASYRRRKISTMSDGERRLASFVFVMSKDTKYVILDEPFTKIDDKRCEEIGRILENVARTKTILLVDHDGCLQSIKYTAFFSLNSTDNFEIVKSEEQTSPAPKKHFRIGHAFALAIHSFSKRMGSFIINSLLFVSLCLFLTLSVLSIPKSEDGVRAFSFNNDPYEYLCVHQSDDYHCDQESLFSLGDGDSFLALVSYPSSLYASDPILESVDLVLTNSVKEEDVLVLPRDGKSLTIDESSYTGNLDINWGNASSLGFSRDSTYLFLAYALHDDLLFVNPATALAMIKDSFFSKIALKDGTPYVSDDGSILLGPINDKSDGDYYDAEIADGEGVFLFPGGVKGESVTIYGASSSSVNVSGASYDGKIHLSNDVLLKVLLETTSSRYAAKRSLDSQLSNLGYKMYSELEKPYLKANKSLLSDFISFLIAFILSFVLLIASAIVMPFSLDKRTGSFLIYSFESPRGMALSFSLPELFLDVGLSVTMVCLAFLLVSMLNTSLETVAFGSKGLGALGGLFLSLPTPCFAASFEFLLPVLLLLGGVLSFLIREFFLEKNKALNLTKY